MDWSSKPRILGDERTSTACWFCGHDNADSTRCIVFKEIIKISILDPFHSKKEIVRYPNYHLIYDGESLKPYDPSIFMKLYINSKTKSIYYIRWVTWNFNSKLHIFNSQNQAFQPYFKGKSISSRTKNSSKIPLWFFERKQLRYI